MKDDELVPLPAGVVTLRAPVDAPDGTAVEICVSETTVNVVAAPFSSRAVAPVKLVPLSVMDVPTGPLLGLNDVICGAETVCVTVNGEVLVPVPAGFVTLMGPVEAPLGTDVLSDVSETTLKLAGIPLNRTADAPLNPEPARITATPFEPLVGVKAETAGMVAVSVTENEDAEVAVPQAV